MRQQSPTNGRSMVHKPTFAVPLFASQARSSHFGRQVLVKAPANEVSRLGEWQMIPDKLERLERDTEEVRTALRDTMTNGVRALQATDISSSYAPPTALPIQAKQRMITNTATQVEATLAEPSYSREKDIEAIMASFNVIERVLGETRSDKAAKALKTLSEARRLTLQAQREGQGKMRDEDVASTDAASVGTTSPRYFSDAGCGSGTTTSQGGITDDSRATPTLPDLDDEQRGASSSLDASLYVVSPSCRTCASAHSSMTPGTPYSTILTSKEGKTALASPMQLGFSPLMTASSEGRRCQQRIS